MNTIHEKAQWKGSIHTSTMVAEQIEQRWGTEEVKNYDPSTNCLTLLRWNMEGFKVKKGEKALKSVTFIEVEVDDKKGGKEMKKIPRNVSLFYYLQVEPKKEVVI